MKYCNVKSECLYHTGVIVYVSFLSPESDTQLLGSETALLHGHLEVNRPRQIDSSYPNLQESDYKPEHQFTSLYEEINCQVD